MKVLQVINGLGTGGAERSLSELLPRLRDRGVEFVIACLSKKPEGVGNAVEEAGFDVRYVGGGSLVAKARAVRTIAMSTGCDLIHTTIFEADLVGRLASLHSGLPVLTSIVNTSYDASRLADPNVKKWKLETVRAIDGLTARRFTTHFHVISETVGHSAVTSLKIDPERMTLIRRGRDLKRLQASGDAKMRLRRELAIDADAPVILNVGRQEFQKNQLSLLKAFQSVLPEFPKARLLIAGRDGNATPDLHKHLAADPELAARVIFLGHRDDVADLLELANVFTFPSRFEGQGGALLEAMLAAKPIVASDLPVLRESVQHEETARLLPADDVDALARELSWVLTNTETAQAMGAKARDAALEKFDIDRIAQQHEALYERVIREHRAKHGRR